MDMKRFRRCLKKGALGGRTFVSAVSGRDKFDSAKLNGSFSFCSPCFTEAY